ncbi:MAG: RNA 2',3'-cyclic phosphodiesterase [Reyranellaceae bacterium]
MIRLFVAIEIPRELRRELARLQNGVPGARWVEPESFHLTLRFIGAVDNAHATDIDDQLARIGALSFELAIKGVGHFMEGGRPSALYAAVENNPALEALQRKVESAVARAGIAPERKRFSPHVTLARFSGRQDAGHHLAQFMASHSLWRPEPFEVEHFSLFSSVMRPEGSLYRVEAEYPLQVIGE